ncbi:GTP-binding protein [Paenibacillus mesophilus]|uniref:putative glycoside hydrolase n=1 Tax=Paenibacillus mesophilus TaxID=2582849 RepID=UPI00110D7328|nr:putative glycoside hydrolase [Paenibacillus mesophilus]TMV47089.1 GTP-binding protein [Paenibacillus mesophilus]
MKSVVRLGIYMTLMASMVGCQLYAPVELDARLPIPNGTPRTDVSSSDTTSNNRLVSSAPYGFLPSSRPKVKGLYVSGWAAGTRKLDTLIELIDQTELNALVIDVKNDSGQVTYDSQLPLVNEFGADSRKMIPDMKRLIAYLKSKDIYTIARVVVFKDPCIASIKPEWALHTKDGSVWRNKHGDSWVDPYNPQVWNYALGVAKEAVDYGFDEIQFDYVRFPDNGRAVDLEVEYSNPNDWSKSAAIAQFLKQAKLELNQKGVYVSADVFGLTASVSDDMGIGQVWSDLAAELDVISPMIYPSHYGNGVYGIEHPDLQPYAVVQQALSDGLHKNEQLAKTGIPSAGIRPWLQDFTAAWVKPHLKYGNEEVQAQIQAAKELGIDEYLLWNPGCTYTFR